MEPAHNLNPYFAEFGRHGGKKRMEQLNAEERRALARHAARARWHRRQFIEEQERAREITYTVIQTLKDKQLPLI